MPPSPVNRSDPLGPPGEPSALRHLSARDTRHPQTFFGRLGLAALAPSFTTLSGVNRWLYPRARLDAGVGANFLLGISAFGLDTIPERSFGSIGPPSGPWRPQGPGTHRSARDTRHPQFFRAARPSASPRSHSPYYHPQWTPTRGQNPSSNCFHKKSFKMTN